MGDRITLLGHLSQKQLKKEMSEASIYLSLTKVDGVSISLLQAMDHGIPGMVLSDVGENRRLAAELPGTIMVDAADLSGLSQILTKSANHITEKIVTSREDYNIVLEKYADWNRNISDICKLLEAIVKDHKIVI